MPGIPPAAGGGRRRHPIATIYSDPEPRASPRPRSLRALSRPTQVLAAFEFRSMPSADEALARLHHQAAPRSRPGGRTREPRPAHPHRDESRCRVLAERRARGDAGGRVLVPGSERDPCGGQSRRGRSHAHGGGRDVRPGLDERLAEAERYGRRRPSRSRRRCRGRRPRTVRSKTSVARCGGMPRCNGRWPVSRIGAHSSPSRSRSPFSPGSRRRSRRLTGRCARRASACARIDDGAGELGCHSAFASTAATPSSTGCTPVTSGSRRPSSPRRSAACCASPSTSCFSRKRRWRRSRSSHRVSRPAPDRVHLPRLALRVYAPGADGSRDAAHDRHLRGAARRPGPARASAGGHPRSMAAGAHERARAGARWR